MYPALSENTAIAVEQQNSVVHVVFLVDQICEMGGAEKMLLRMIQLLPRDRFRCSVVTFKIDPTLPIFREFPCRLEILPLKRTYGLSGIRVARQLHSFIRSEGVRIVHTFFETADLWGGVIARLSGCPVLISSRRDMGIMRTWKHHFAYRVCSRLFDEVQTVSEEVRRFCIKYDHVAPRKVRTLYNGVALSNQQASFNRGATVPGAEILRRASHIITTVGHVRPVKGFDVFIKAAAVVCRSYPRAAFVIAGRINDTRHYAELVELAASLGVTENVHFIGNVECPGALLAASNVFCLLSRSEGLSNALLEAMAAGVPCVATRVGGNPELIEDAHTGYMVESEDAGAAAQAILSLLERPEAACEMGSRGRHLVQEQFTESAMMERLVRSYERLLFEHA